MEKRHGQVTARSRRRARLRDPWSPTIDFTLACLSPWVVMKVFGRTMQAKDVANGRQHNDGHHVTVMIGAGVRSSEIGGVAQPAARKQYRATPIDSATGQASATGDVPFGDTFGAMGQTLAAAVGLASDTIAANVLTGKPIAAALAS